MSEFWQWFDDCVSSKLGGRSNTFRKMFKHLDKFENPTIIETGCIRHNGVWVSDAWAGDGCSTILFDKYVLLNGGQFYSVDIDFENVQNAITIVGKNSKIYCNDSIEFLKDFVKGIIKGSHLCKSVQLAYLDSGYSPSEVETQVRQFNELMILMSKVTPDTLVVTDDSPLLSDEVGKYVIGGRGGVINQYANEHGIECIFSEYQTGWVGFPGVISDFKGLLLKARKLTEEGKWKEAYPFYRKVYMLVKECRSEEDKKIYSEVCVYFARMASDYSSYGTSYDWYRRALTADSSANNYRLEMITRAMMPLGWMTVARLEAIRATEIDPENPIAWNILGEVEEHLKNRPASLTAYSKFVDVSNRSTLSLLTKAKALIGDEKYEEAEVLCDEVIARNESLDAAFVCKADILANQGNHEEAIDLYNKILSNKDDSMLKYLLSLSLFSVGRHKEGWQNSFRARIANETFAPLYLGMRRFTKPLKQLFVMQPPPAVVHIHADSGEGDNIAMMRYLPLLVERGYTVRYEARKGVLKLASDSFPQVEVIPLAHDFPGVAGLPDFDYHLPIADLPFIFQTDIDTIPCTGPYIKADPELVDKYKVHKGKIGIVWSTGPIDIPDVRYTRRKSIEFNLLKPIIDINPELFISLQVGPERLNNNIIVDPMPVDEITWADTAAIVKNLDLVITIDTSVAHLAGAMGKPTWLMMHKYLTSWQFMAERPNASWNTSSPWYPSMRIFRQKTRGDWGPVITSISNELAGTYVRN